MRKTCAAVVVAAGSATRMQGIDKMLAPLAGVPVVLRSVRALAASDCIDSLVIVTRTECMETLRTLCAEVSKPVTVVVGGASRPESVLAGLAALPEGTELAAIHDGARPLVTQSVIAEAVEAAGRCGAAAPAVPVHDTIKQAENGLVRATPERKTLFAVQTPQVFDVKLLKTVLRAAMERGIALTDDCSAVEAAGKPVVLTQGCEENLKITTPVDLTLAEAILKRRKTMRIGHGYDVHRLTEGRRLILGGVEIPFERGLDGHSDADVLVHALMDALLGAAGLRDIGVLFPDNDPAYKNISSMLLLDRVMQTLERAGYAVGNVDVTVLAQRPKLKDYIPVMRENLAYAMKIPLDCVNIKATTEEGLGFTGSGEGIACHAVCLLER